MASIVVAFVAAGLVVSLTADEPRSDPPETPVADAGSEPADREPVQRVLTGSPEVDQTPSIEPLDDRPALPESIAIPDVGIEGEIVPVADAADGIVIPEPSMAGFYRFGPRPGEVGRSIIVGHINSIEGPALFSNLGAAENEATVEITDRDGVEHVYEVTEQLQIAKADFPAERIYGSTGEAELVMITCGGEYDEETGFEDNVIVFARAVD